MMFPICKYSPGGLESTQNILENIPSIIDVWSGWTSRCFSAAFNQNPSPHRPFIQCNYCTEEMKFSSFLDIKILSV